MLVSLYCYMFIFFVFNIEKHLAAKRRKAKPPKEIPTRLDRTDILQKPFGIDESLARDIKLHGLRLRKLLTSLRTGKGTIPPWRSLPTVSNSVLDKEELFFDDILLMPKQIDDIFLLHHKPYQLYRARMRKTKQRVKRNMKIPRVRYKKAPFHAEKWNLPIPYIISDESNHNIPVIVAAISHIEQHTCIRFKHQPWGAVILGRVVLFNINQAGCASQVGRTGRNGLQHINIGSCTPTVGVIVHEIVHCLGFLHVQTKTDADKHVTIKMENIIPGKEVNFLPFPEKYVKNFGQLYDFNSVMHYDKFSGSANSLPTILTKDPLFNKNIGQTTGLSFYDKQVLNRVYCKGTCLKKLPCKRAGFTDPNNCSQCVCNDGFGGRLCERTGPSQDNCLPNTRSIIRVTSQTEKCLESPNYESEGYKPFSECNWYLKSRKGTKIALSFSGNFSVYCNERTQTCFHWVEIKYREKMTYPGPRFCCQSKPPQKLVSNKNEVLISFRSSFDSGHMTKSVMGFRLCYKLHTKKR